MCLHRLCDCTQMLTKRIEQNECEAKKGNKIGLCSYGICLKPFNEESNRRRKKPNRLMHAARTSR